MDNKISLIFAVGLGLWFLLVLVGASILSERNYRTCALEDISIILPRISK